MTQILQLPYTSEEILAIMSPPVALSNEIVLLDEQEVTTSKYTFDLSNYLPSDKNYYEIRLSGWASPTETSKRCLIIAEGWEGKFFLSMYPMSSLYKAIGFSKKIIIGPSRSLSIHRELANDQCNCIMTLKLASYKFIGRPQTSNS